MCIYIYTYQHNTYYIDIHTRHDMMWPDLTWHETIFHYITLHDITYILVCIYTYIMTNMYMYIYICMNILHVYHLWVSCISMDNTSSMDLGSHVESEVTRAARFMSRFTPKSSTLIGFSIINHPFGGSPILGNLHVSNHWIS